MSIVSTTVLAFSMSADAFAASIGKGAALKRPRIAEALRIGAIFGVVEALTPLIGWCAGIVASQYITEIDHWVAFVILGAVGMKLIYEGFSKEDDEPKTEKHKLGLVILTAIGTSIDAMAVGVTLAFLPVNIWISAAAIGAATCLMVTIGIMTGHYIGNKAGKWAEVLGGVGLIAIGTTILCDHMGWM